MKERIGDDFWWMDGMYLTVWLVFFWVMVEVAFWTLVEGPVWLLAPEVNNEKTGLFWIAIFLSAVLAHRRGNKKRTLWRQKSPHKEL